MLDTHEYHYPTVDTAKLTELIGLLSSGKVKPTNAVNALVRVLEETALNAVIDERERAAKLVEGFEPIQGAGSAVDAKRTLRALATLIRLGL